MKLIKKLLPFLIILLIITAASTGGYFYFKYQKAQKELEKVKNNPAQQTKAAEDEITKLVAEVSKIVVLPSDETPTLATISDINLLKSQDFFKNAKNGDKLLIYRKAKKGYLYDPVAKKLLDIGPVQESSASANIQNPAQSQATSSAAISSVRVLILNGTNTVGLTTRYEPEIKKALDKAEIVDKDNASNKDYDRTIVVAVNETFKPQAQTLAKALKGSVESLPAGENQPKGADLVVILGKDKR